MKKLYLIGCTALLLGACNKTSQDYQLTGTFEGDSLEYVLVGHGANNISNADTVRIAPDGSFSYTRKMENPEVGFLYVPDKAFYSLVMINGTKTQLKAMKAPEAGWLPEGFEAPKGGAHAGTFGDLTPGEMVKTPRFWVLIVTFAFAATAGTLLVGKVASIAAVQLFADPTSAAAVALGGVVVSVNTCANLVGRLSFGQIIDKLGAYKSLLISLVVTIVALVIMSMSFTQSMFFVALALLGFSFGALLVIYPPLTGGAFGTSNIGVNYGIMFLGYAASTWISQPITAVLYHAEAGSAAYQQSFYGAIVIAAIAVVLTVYMMVSDSKKKSA